MGQRCVLRILKMPVFIREVARVALRERLKMNVGAKLVKVRIERSFAIVVIYFSVRDLGVLDGEIENTGAAAAALTGRRSGKVVLSIGGDLNVHDWMVDRNLAQRDLAAQSRNDSELDGEFVCMEQGRLITCFGAAQSNVVEVSRQCAEGPDRGGQFEFSRRSRG